MKHHDPAMDEPLSDATEVRKAYDALPDAGVPADLDARIFARARAAVSKPDNVVELKQPASSSAAIKRWAIPLTAAASVVMVMSVVYEVQRSTPSDSTAIVSKLEAPATDVPGSDNRRLAPVAPAPDVVDVQIVEPSADQTVAPAMEVAPVPMFAPAPEPAVAAESPPAPVLAEAMPPPPPAAPAAAAGSTEERIVTTSELYQERKTAARNEASAVAAQAQRAGRAAKLADSTSPPASLARLAGHYRYDSYTVTLATGQVLGLRELGATAATLDISTQGTLTLRMNMTNGQTLTQTARILDTSLDGNSGYWIAQWPDMNYAVKAIVVIDGDKLTSITRFEDRTDTARFGSVERAALKRGGGD